MLSQPPSDEDFRFSETATNELKTVVKNGSTESTSTLTAYPGALSRPQKISPEEKSLLRRLDLRILPPVTLLYLLSFLDRSNVGNAKLEGLVEDLNMTGDHYLNCLSLFFVGYVLFEIPCNIILKRTSPRAWLPTLTLVWGIVATLMGITQSYGGFLATRFFLGVAESGLFPDNERVVFYLSMWYKRNEQHYRIALFFSAASLAGAFGGILAWAIAHMKGVGGLNGWRWIFILEGLITILVSTSGYAFVTNYPQTATFLSDKDRQLIKTRLESDSDAGSTEGFTWGPVLDAVKDYKIWLYGAAFHTMALPLYTLSLFMPTIIKELGFTAAEAQLMTVPPYALATVLSITIAILSERLRRRAPFILFSTSLSIIGYIILMASTSSKLSYFGTFLATAGIYPSTMLVLSWSANNVSGQTKRATANAAQNAIGTAGAVWGVQLYRPEWAGRFYAGHGTALGYLVANLFVVGLLWALLRRENQRRDRGERDHRLQAVREGESLGDEDPRWRFQT